MQITVDTKHDSHEEIRKVIAILEHLVGDKKIVSNASQSDVSPIPSAQEATSDLSSSPSIAQPLTSDPLLANQTLNDLFSVEGSLQAPEESQAHLPPAQTMPSAPTQKMEDPFSDLFTMDDVSEKMDGKEEESDEGFSPSKKPKIEFY